MSQKVLKNLLATVTKLRYSKPNELYKLVLETALVRADVTPYLPEINELLTRYPECAAESV